MRSGRRVLFAHPGAEMYGSDRMAIETVRAIVAAGARVLVVVPEDGPLLAELTRVGCQTLVVKTPVLRKELLKPLGLLKLIWALFASIPDQVQVIRRFGPNTVWANTLTQPHWLAIARLFRIATVCHVREAENGRSGIVRSVLLAPLNLARLVLVNSEATRLFVLGTPVYRSSARVQVLYNGKDWSPYFRTAPRRLDKEGVELVCVGRLNPRKGQDLVLEAMVQLRDKGISLNLVVVGDVYPGYEWYRDQLHSVARENELCDHVTFVGFVDDPSEYLANSDIVIVPSRVEPFGTVAAEAMAAMRPTVVAATEGLLEIVTDRSNGRTFCAGSSNDLADVIYELVSDPDEALRLAAKGRDSVSDRFSLDRYSQGVVNALETVSK